jgi:hypothetical protein
MFVEGRIFFANFPECPFELYDREADPQEYQTLATDPK